MKANYMNPYLAGFFLGLVLLATVFITGHGLGASGALKSTVVASVKAIAPGTTAGNDFFRSTPGTSPLKTWLVFEMAGVVLGAFLSGVISDRLTFETERGPHITNGLRLGMALIGGALFGIGAEFGRGCTSGAALSGMAVLSFGGIITMMAIFGSAYAVAFFFRKLWN